jgi:hypothetical protein
MPLPWERKRTLEEVQAENERLDVELSVEQKRAAIKKLKENGLTPKSFGGSWQSIIKWLKTH